MKTKRHYQTLAVIIFLTGCTLNKNTEITQEADNRFVKPAFTGFDVPFESYSLQAETGDTLFYPSGTIVLFPPQSFVDKDGQVVFGSVSVRYRELSNPADYLVSGIPMEYDSNGNRYMYESSGMLEITAFQGDEPVFVNPVHKPEVNLASRHGDASFNLYYLDTISQKWIAKGKDVITDLNVEKKQMEVATKTPKPEKTIDLIEPVEPAKANGKLPTFKILVSEGSTPELMAYNNLMFEVDPDDKNYLPEESKKFWNDVKVEKASRHGTYLVTFISYDKSLSILTRPVFEGKAYDEAMKIFEKQQKEYETLLTARLKNEKKVKAEMEKQAKLAEAENKNIRKENEKIDKFNALMEARNRLIQTQNLLVEAQNRIVIEEQRRQKMEQERQDHITMLVSLIEANDPSVADYDSSERKEAMKIVEDTRLQRETYKKEIAEQKRKTEEGINQSIKMETTKGAAQLYSNIVRTFALDGFGIWNSDSPIMLSSQGAITLNAKFYDEQNRVLPVYMVQVVYKNINGVNTHHDCDRNFTYPRLYVIPGKENMIWTVLNEQLYYLSFDDFRQAGITQQTREYSFTMKRYPGKITSCEDIRKVVSL